MSILAGIIFVVHLLFVLWAIWAPFSGVDAMIILHVTAMGSVMLHWLLRDSTCCLTLLEAYVRGIPPDQSFFYRLISPVYKQASDEVIRTVVWIAALLLWSRSVYLVAQRPSMILEVLLPFRNPKKKIGGVDQTPLPN